MRADPDRVSRIQHALADGEYDAMVCALPANVLLLSGYCPVVGASIGIVTSDGKVTLLVPEDEEELAAAGRADEIRVFSAGSTKKVESVGQAVREPLSGLVKDLRLDRAVIGYESGEMTQPATYVALHLYGGLLRQMLGDALPGAQLLACDEMLAILRSVKTAAEIDAIQLSCRLATDAFERGVEHLVGGMTEAQAAANFRFALLGGHAQLQDAGRLDGWFFCASGPNSYTAYRAYQRSRGRQIGESEPALVHCNSQYDGWWTDITRTYCIGQPTAIMFEAMQALLEARDAAMAVIRPGAAGADVDRAARGVLAAHGFGDAFKHPAGHGVGFSAINHNARPRLHPQSPDILEQGMVFNLEPGVYLQGVGGMRHCDMVAVGARGARLLTNFQGDIGSLLIGSHGEGDGPGAMNRG